MLSYGVISLLALATASSAGPISVARRDSSLIPAIPPACLAIASNSTAISVSNSTNLTDTSSLSNVTGIANTTSTCLVPASDISGLNDTDLYNNCTNMTNSTSTSDNSTSASYTYTATAASSTDTSTDSSSTSSATDLSPTDTATATSSTDTSTATSTSGLTSDSPADDGDDDNGDGDNVDGNNAGDDSGDDDDADDDDSSSGIPDPSTGQFTANTSDPSGRRKRSLQKVVLHSPVPRRLHRTILSHHRRLAQTDLPTVAQNWQDLCLASGGDIFTNQPCVNLAGVAGINALLSTGGVCDQQDNADNMIDFAKSPGVTNQAALIAAAIAYRQHPRNADDIGGGVVPSTPYCTEQPRNPELVGIVNAQLPGVNPGLFGGPNTPIVAFGADGTCPAGQTPDASTCSCS